VVVSGRAKELFRPDRPDHRIEREGGTPRTLERVLRETGRDVDLAPNVAAVATAGATRRGNNS
jgi:protein-disulfide isomerase-like protein with CxxC motif